MELFRALCAVAEDNAAVVAAHPWYASLMERTLSKVVLVHVAGLERLCQVRSLRLHSATFQALAHDLHMRAQTFSQIITLRNRSCWRCQAQL